MKKVEGTIRRDGRYHLKRRIPAELMDLPEYRGKEFVRRSLKTADPVLAAKEVTKQDAKFLHEIEAVTAKRAADAAHKLLTEEQRKLLDEAGGVPGLVRQHEAALISLRFLAAGDPRGADVGQETEGGYGTPPRRVSGGDAVADEFEDRNEGAVSDLYRHDHLAFARQTGKALLALGQKAEIPGGGDVTTLRELAEAYFEHKGTPRLSRRAFTYPVRRFDELHGVLNLRDLKRDHLREYGEKAKQLTPSRKGGAHELPFWENVRYAKRHGLELMADEARRKHTDHLKYLTKFAVEEGYLDADPFAGYRLPQARRKFSQQAEKKRHPFSGGELEAILAQVVEDYHPVSIDRWAPLLATYQGARREEIGQIMIDDVVQIDGEWVIKVTDEGDDQKVKNRDSLRNLPIHPAVAEAGFINFVRERKRAVNRNEFLFRQEKRMGTGRLHDLKLDADERLTGAYGKRFAALLKRLGIKKHGIVFHSFRHSWEDAAELADIKDAHRKALAGRAAGGGSQSAYGDGPTIRAGRDALAKVNPMQLTAEGKLRA